MIAISRNTLRKKSGREKRKHRGLWQTIVNKIEGRAFHWKAKWFARQWKHFHRVGGHAEIQVHKKECPCSIFYTDVFQRHVWEFWGSFYMMSKQQMSLRFSHTLEVKYNSKGWVLLSKPTYATRERSYHVLRHCSNQKI